jgi:hypothetical protein
MIEPRVRVNGSALARHVGKPISIMGTVLSVSFHMIKHVFFFLRFKYIYVDILGLLFKCSPRS